jgi:preprotein translocase subunit YajC
MGSLDLVASFQIMYLGFLRKKKKRKKKKEKRNHF